MTRSCHEHSTIKMVSLQNSTDANRISGSSMISKTVLPSTLLSTKQQLNSLSLLEHEDASTSSSTVGATSTSTSSCGTGDHPHDAATFARILHLPAKPRARRRELGTGHEYWETVPVLVKDYRREAMQGGKMGVRVASASMDCKGEDRCNVAFLNHTDDITIKNNHCLQFFCGVYDGHDGPDAANYCATGLLPHILMELSQQEEQKVTRSSERHPDKRRRGLFRRFSVKSSNNQSLGGGDEENNDNDSASNTARRLAALEPQICRAFEQAHARFAETGTPPSLSALVQEQTMTTQPLEPLGKLSTLMRRARPEENIDNRRINRSRPGGTTACTLSIFCSANDNDKTDGTDSDLFALVANCGDSRLVSDHGSSHFRTVTKDHRVVEDVEDPEMVRLHAANARVQNHRIYPGGLAVSRTIGDTAYAAACIPTPDCYALYPGSQRIILATDGLWDALQVIVTHQKQHEQTQSKHPNHRRATTSRRVEAILDQLAGRDCVADPKTAAINLMKRCLREVGCVDDITIVVVDISQLSIRT